MLIYSCAICAFCDGDIQLRQICFRFPADDRYKLCLLYVRFAAHTYLLCCARMITPLTEAQRDVHIQLRHIYMLLLCRSLFYVRVVTYTLWVYCARLITLLVEAQRDVVIICFRLGCSSPINRCVCCMFAEQLVRFCLTRLVEAASDGAIKIHDRCYVMVIYSCAKYAYALLLMTDIQLCLLYVRFAAHTLLLCCARPITPLVEPQRDVDLQLNHKICFDFAARCCMFGFQRIRFCFAAGG